MAAVARSSHNNSPHLGGKSMTASPRSNRTSVQKPEAVPTIKQPDDEPAANGAKDTNTSTNGTTLGPPPKPSQNTDGDYFGTQHTQSQTHLSKEPNPFESAFTNPAETPGKTQLPGVTSLTSPASLLPGNTPGWPGSLRSGPLSPAMLTGPTGQNDYFNSDHHFSGSFPTPNESSLRSGLTPGGGGSMFPVPSPNSQALYNQLQSGGATPGTLDFHRTAMTARAQSQANNFSMTQNGATSQPQQSSNIQPDLDSKPFHSNNQTSQPDTQDPFSSHQTNDAANGLFMLAQAGGQRNAQQQFPQNQQNYQQGAQQERNARGNKGSVGSNMSNSTDGGDGQFSDDADTKTQTRSKGKKGSGAKGSQNGKRKTEETPSKAQPVKKQRGSTGPVFDEMEDDDMDDGLDDPNIDRSKMTDEEKRKNFLERNRIAALKCRQRKKQWLANLQQKVEMFSTENDALAATVTQLREEIVGLKTLLLAHKDCPVSQAQGISSSMIQQIAGDTQGYANPYGMAIGPQQGQMGQNGMQRS